MYQKINDKIDELNNELLESIARIVKIKSVEEKPTEDAPYGAGPKAALLETLKLSEELGFKTKNIGNHAGYAQYGEGDDDADYIGIFGHLDVVPEGEGWNYEPYGAEIDNNRMYGRGVLDNKGPIITALYSLYALKELGVTFKMPIRIVFGTNEETGFNDMKYFLEHEKAPVFGWTPDNKFPVVYGERGRALFRVYQGEASRKDFYQYLNDYLLSSASNGNKLGVNYKDDDFGEMIMRGFSINLDESEEAYFQFSLSYPAVTNAQELTEDITKTLSDGLRLELAHNFDPVLNDKDSKYVPALTKAYEDITGLDSTPTTTTGGTYAKMVPNILAFGPSFPGQNGIGHLPDEWMDLDDINNIAKIYAQALYNLKEVL